MTDSNLTELERRVASVLHQDAQIAMGSTDTEARYRDFVASTDSALHRRRIAWGIGAVGAVAAVVIALMLGGVPGLPSNEADTQLPASDGASASPTSIEAFETELSEILVQAPGWAISDTFPGDYDYAFNGPCSGNWGERATSGSDGGLASAGIGGFGFLSEAQASDAAARFVENLESCTATAWKTQPVAQTGAVLASSATGVAWIQRTGDHVDVLQVPTTDGPPPGGVQLEVAEWMVAYRTFQEQD